ncbi:unnamed protein product [marine sediment metagenome]|uniref:Uncharacterized protein n=1 Tax=marine sediment metagenome TaxID=412755 RepID=X1NWF4_9ZZZZ
MSYLDTDELIEEREKDSISAIFKKKGEEYFRRLETKVVKEVALLDNFVISTGGGVVLREEVTVVSKEDLSPYIQPYILREAEKIEG